MTPAPRSTWRIEAGETVPPAARGQALALHRGEVALSANGRLFEFRRAPALLLVRPPIRATAVDTVEVEPIDLERLDRAAMMDLLEGELTRHHAWQAEELRKSDDFFADDRGTLVPGPYRFGPYRATSLLMRGDTRAILPRGLRPIPGLGDRFLVTLSEIERCRAQHPATDHRDHRYLEVAAFVPCLGPRLSPGLFLPEVYPDAYLPILLGREVYGFAKKMGRVLIGEDGFDLVASGTHRLRVRWREAGGVVSPKIEQALAVARWIGRIRRPRLWLHKRIADVRAGARARSAIDQLVALPFTVRTLAEPELLRDVEVSYPDGKWSLPGRCEGAMRMSIAFDFADGHVAASRRRSRYP